MTSERSLEPYADQLIPKPAISYTRPGANIWKT